MNIEIDYIKGVAETTLSFYESINGTIDPDKCLELSYDTITDSKTAKLVIGCKITFTWKLEVSREWHIDSKLDDNYLKIYSKDNLDSVISDISSVLTDIDSQLIIK